MLKTLWLGLTLRCPNCGNPTLSDGIFSMNQQCRVCSVVFERRSGESAGASIIWLSVLPLLALIIFFVIYVINPELPLTILLGVPVLFVLVAGVVGYRHMRGLWIAITYLTGDVYADNETESSDDS